METSSAAEIGAWQWRLELCSVDRRAEIENERSEGKGSRSGGGGQGREIEGRA